MTVAAAIRAGLIAALRRAISAVLWMALLCFGGVASIVAGVFVLWGVGPALIAGGVLGLLASALLLIGIRRG